MTRNRTAVLHKIRLCGEENRGSQRRAAQSRGAHPSGTLAAFLRNGCAHSGSGATAQRAAALAAEEQLVQALKAAVSAAGRLPTARRPDGPGVHDHAECTALAAQGLRGERLWTRLAA
jgi:hypothetical protein